MRVLYLSLEPPLDTSEVATGNQMRAAMLVKALTDAGHDCVQQSQTSWTQNKIERSIRDVQPDAVLLGYWLLAERMPEHFDRPLIVDCIAPRPLEEHFVDPLATPAMIQRYTRALARADLILVGNARQRTLLAGWLLTAGEDLREAVPIVELPLAVESPDEPRSDHGSPLVLATGGQDWAWRDASDWLAALTDPPLDSAVELHHFGARKLDSGAVEHGLVAWREWQRFLAERAHVGVELAEANFERELAQPFRIASFLHAGLPLLINDYLPMAGNVREYNAGWVVATREEARAAVREALNQPETWREKAAGAQRLASERFEPGRCARPLLEWLEAPRKRHTTIAPTAAPTSGALERQPSLLGMIARKLLRPVRREIDGEGVVVITRADLFPTDHGAAVKIVETARGLARTTRPVAIVTADRSRYWFVGAHGIEERPLPWWLRMLALPKIASHAIHRLRGLPASNAFLYWPLYDPGYGLRAAWVGRAIDAGVALAEFPGYAQSARICRMLNGGHAVLAEHNVEYLRLAEQLTQLSPRAFRKLKNSELKLANCMDAVVCVSDRDRAQLIADGLSPGQQMTIPHGVDLPAFEAAEPSDLAADFGFDPDRPVLAYHGTFSYPPNRQALLIIIEELLPRLERLGHRLQVLGIGREAPPGIDHPDVRLPGSLEELAGPLKPCSLAVVPLTSGGGTRMKILDYFAAGLPVISTSKGCEGLPVGDGEQLLIRDDWDAFAQAVADLLENEDQRRALGEAGHELARSLSWQEIAGRYDQLFRRLA
ncbi:MAG: glycosyltransferase [Xanthomonadales bacterium]|nr:glycosyltransferase [Xanthomonadales bacterium]